jgi:hypothetical protein
MINPNPPNFYQLSDLRENILTGPKNSIPIAQACDWLMDIDTVYCTRHLEFL